MQITTIVSLTEATEGSKKCLMKASRRRSSNGCSLLLTAYGPGRICSEACSDASGQRRPRGALAYRSCHITFSVFLSVAVEITWERS